MALVTSMGAATIATSPSKAMAAARAWGLEAYSARKMAVNHNSEERTGNEHKKDNRYFVNTNENIKSTPANGTQQRIVPTKLNAGARAIIEEMQEFLQICTATSQPRDNVCNLRASLASPRTRISRSRSGDGKAAVAGVTLLQRWLLKFLHDPRYLIPLEL